MLERPVEGTKSDKQVLSTTTMLPNLCYIRRVTNNCVLGYIMKRDLQDELVVVVAFNCMLRFSILCQKKWQSAKLNKCAPMVLEPLWLLSAHTLRGFIFIN